MEVSAWSPRSRGLLRSRNARSAIVESPFFLVALTLVAMAGMTIGLAARIAQNAPIEGTAALAFLIMVGTVWLLIVRRVLRHDARVIREAAKIR